MVTETITISLDEYEKMKEEIKELKEGKLYKRLLQFEENIAKGNKYNRKDLGF